MTTVAIPTPQLKPHLSHSGLHTYTDCGKRFQLTRVLGLPESPGYALAGGSAVHAATEQYDRMLFAESGR